MERRMLEGAVLRLIYSGALLLCILSGGFDRSWSIIEDSFNAGIDSHQSAEPGIGAG